MNLIMDIGVVLLCAAALYIIIHFCCGYWKREVIKREELRQKQYQAFITKRQIENAKKDHEK